MKQLEWYLGIFLSLMLSIWLPTGALATSFPAGVGPWAVAVNPVTNKAYIANYNYNPSEVTVIDRITNATTTITAGFSPAAVAVNPVTNKIYVANFNGDSVSVIDGATDTVVATVSDSLAMPMKGPAAIAVNPETNTVYIGNYKSRNVTVINGATNLATAVVSLNNMASVSVAPLMGMAMNPVTNKVYVTNYNDNSVTVIDGATNTSNNITVGTNPWAVAVNPRTNKIYVINFTSNNVSVIDGASNNASLPISVNISPKAVAINPVTNRIYVVNSNYGGSGSVSVIDGTTDSILPAVTTGLNSQAITVNSVTNKVYVANASSNNVTMIDVANSNQTTSIPAGTFPVAVAVNMITNEVYVANKDPQDPNVSPKGTVTVIAETPVLASPLPTSITSLPGDTTGSATPTFTMTATSSTGSPVRTVYYQVDSIQGAWLEATPAAGGTFSGTTSALALGTHTLYAFATDGSDATSINTGSQSSPLIGAIAAYSFIVSSLPPVTYTVMPVITAHGSISPNTPQTVNPNTIIDFIIKPDNGYKIVTVTGCNGTLINPTTLTNPTTYRTGPITATCEVMPTFSTNLLPVRIGSTYYSTLLEAYAKALPGDIIQATAASFSGSLNIGIVDTLQGGYDVTYASQTGNTILIGTLTIGAGSMVVDRLIIQ